jgi:hypothetical protein
METLFEADLSCCNNRLTSLDVSNNPNIEWLQCGGNQITTLNVSNNRALRVLEINDMPTLNKVCVWTVPFSPADFQLRISGSRMYLSQQFAKVDKRISDFRLRSSGSHILKLLTFVSGFHTLECVFPKVLINSLSCCKQSLQNFNICNSDRKNPALAPLPEGSPGPGAMASNHLVQDHRHFLAKKS